MIHVVVQFYNSPWIGKCIASLRSQTGPEFRVVAIDDASTDGSYDRMRDAVVTDPRFTLVRNEQRDGALANLCRAIDASGAEAEDVIVTVDGDDWLPHSLVLDIIAATYSNPRVLLTYGQAVTRLDGHVEPTEGYPDETVHAKSYRWDKWRATHLRTFRHGLWNKLGPSDLINPKTGQHWEMAWDCAMMFPMLELCEPGQAVFINEILYVYNDVNPIGDNKVDYTKQRRMELAIRAMPVRT